jgi:hypothetical protein
LHKRITTFINIKEPKVLYIEFYEKKYFFIYIFISLLTLKSYSQNVFIPIKKGQAEVNYLGEKLIIKPRTIDQLKKTAVIYRYQMDSLLIKRNTRCSTGGCKENFDNAKEFEKLISGKDINLETIFSKRHNLEEEVFYNNTMLNILFGNEVTAYANNASDLSLNKYYAGLDSEDGSISFAINFNPRERSKLKPLKWFFSAGFKVKSEENFATIFKNGKFENNDLAVTGKTTWVGDGTIVFSSSQSANQNKNKGKTEPVYDRTETIRNFRRELLKRYEEKINQYAVTDFPKEKDSINLLYNKKYNQKEDAEKKTEEFIESKYEDFYAKIAGEEINYMKKNKLYRYLTSHWFTFDFYAPIGEKTYTTAMGKENPTTSSIKFYQLKANLTGTKFWKFSNEQSIYLTGRLSAFNNNNIIADDIKASTFQTIYPQSPTQQVIESEDKNVYILQSGYDNFVTGNVKLEVVYFFLDWLGFSPAVEKNFGQYYHPLNYKIGIPLSLKDKDGKANVNLEAQYKKINNTELYGISVSFFLGKFLN